MKLCGTGLFFSKEQPDLLPPSLRKQRSPTLPRHTYSCINVYKYTFHWKVRTSRTPERQALHPICMQKKETFELARSGLCPLGGNCKRRTGSRQGLECVSEMQRPTGERLIWYCANWLRCLAGLDSALCLDQSGPSCGASTTWRTGSQNPNGK